jgi:N-acetylmuramidase
MTTMTVADYHDHGDVESSKSLTLTESDFETCADMLNVDVRAIKTIAAVESRGGGFFPDNTPKTLFEAHKFYKYTDGLFAESDPDLCVKNWTPSLYGKNWREEKKRFYRAEALDQEAALLSCSWGMFQIMGFNFKACGFKTVFDFVKAMHKDEGEHLKALGFYLRARPEIHESLQMLDWYGASIYNGSANRDDWTAKARKAWETFA